MRYQSKTHQDATKMLGRRRSRGHVTRWTMDIDAELADAIEIYCGEQRIYRTELIHRLLRQLVKHGKPAELPKEDKAEEVARDAHANRGNLFD